MKAIVDQDTCIGCGLCVQVAPGVYEMKGDKAVTKMADIPATLADEAKSGAEQCPVGAIAVS